MKIVHRIIKHPIYTRRSYTICLWYKIFRKNIASNNNLFTRVWWILYNKTVIEWKDFKWGLQIDKLESQRCCHRIYNLTFVLQRSMMPFNPEISYDLYIKQTYFYISCFIYLLQFATYDENNLESDMSSILMVISHKNCPKNYWFKDNSLFPLEKWIIFKFYTKNNFVKKLNI